MKIFNRFLALGLFALALYELFVWADKGGLGIILSVMFLVLAYLVYNSPAQGIELGKFHIRKPSLNKAQLKKTLIVTGWAIFIILISWGIVWLVDYQGTVNNVKSLSISNSHYELDSKYKCTRLQELYGSCRKAPMNIVATIHNNGQYTMHSVRGHVIFIKDGKPYAKTGTTWITTGSITRGTDFVTTINGANNEEVRATDNGTHLGWLHEFMDAQTPFELKMETAIRN